MPFQYQTKVEITYLRSLPQVLWRNSSEKYLLFSRFGNLIDVWMMKDRNFGYAKFASKESADAAIEGMHGHEVLGMKLKVMHADPPKSEASRKRPRT